MEEQLMNIKNDALSLILDAKDEKSLEEIKLQFVGRSGKLTLALKNIAKLPLEKRPEIGSLANEVKTTIEEAIDRQEAMVKDYAMTKKKENIDTTAPGVKPALGHFHPMTLVLSDVVEVFKEIGFQAADGPE